jgi:uncharacterized protein
MAQLLISLHDATPFHLPRLRRAEALFSELGLRKLTYLLVPQYHGGYPSDQDAEFVQWCRAPRPFGVQWFLHGFHHLEAPVPGGASSLSERWKRRLLTAGEGEFLALDTDGQRRKLAAGREVFRNCLQGEPQGFVAPAWLFNAGLPPLLRESGIRYTEDHRRVFRVDAGTALAAPVITWATRTWLRKYGSLAVCPFLAWKWRDRPIIRAAMHPFDFDHGSTLRNIRQVLKRLLGERQEAFAEDLEFPAPVS